MNIYIRHLRKWNFLFLGVALATLALPTHAAILNCPERLVWAGGAGLTNLAQVTPDEDGNWLPRGGRLIPIDKDKELFTAVAADEATIKLIESLPGFKSKQEIRKGVYVVDVDSSQRDTAMDQFRSVSGGIAHHTYTVPDENFAQYFLTERIVVRFRAGLSNAEVTAFSERNGVRVIEKLDGLENTYLVEVKADSGKNPVKTANALNRQSEQVAWAEPDLLNRLLSRAVPTPNGRGEIIPSDELFGKQWHLHRGRADLTLTPEQLKEYNDLAGIGAPKAWATTMGEGATIAIIDDGFDIKHPDLAKGDKLVKPKDFSDGDVNPLPAGDDYHGTACAGVAVASINGSGVVGVAPGCNFMPVRFPLSVADSELSKIFDYVSKDADVISCSWGPPPMYAPMSSLMSAKFTELATSGGPRGKGIVIVYAAGNWNSPINDPDNKEFKWFDYGLGMVRTTKGPILDGFAAHPSVMAAAASNSYALKSYYSSWGNGISVSAPSNNFSAINPRKKVEGLGIVTTDNEDDGQGFTEGSRFTDRFGGTSSAAPTVAGVMALIRSANPDLTAAEAIRVAQDTATKIEDPRTDAELGTAYGKYEKQADGRMWSPWFGYGRIDAENAVARAVALKNAKKVASDFVASFLRDHTSVSATEIGKLLNVNLPQRGFNLVRDFKITVESFRVGGRVRTLLADATTESLETLRLLLLPTANETVLAALATGQQPSEAAARKRMIAALQSANQD